MWGNFAKVKTILAPALTLWPGSLVARGAQTSESVMMTSIPQTCPELAAIAETIVEGERNISGDGGFCFLGAVIQ